MKAIYMAAMGSPILNNMLFFQELVLSHNGINFLYTHKTCKVVLFVAYKLEAVILMHDSCKLIRS